MSKQPFSWDSQTLIKTIPHGNNTEIRIYRNTRGSKAYIDIRLYYRDEDSLSMRPSSKGINIPNDLVDEVATILLHSGEIKKDA